MSLQFLHFLALPDHSKPGGFDHAAIHPFSNRLYVAHTVNDAVDVIDCASDQYLYSIQGLIGIAGALVSVERNLVFTSNRGENTVGIFPIDDEKNLVKVAVGVRPNGLSFDQQHGLLLVANVGNPDIPGSLTLSIVDINRNAMIHSIPVPGRTRWAVYNTEKEVFYVNISDPPQIMTVKAVEANRIAQTLEIPASGPHGLDLDSENQRLFCACDAGKLFVVDLETHRITGEASLSGAPDVIFYNADLNHLYVAIGDPGVIDVFETLTLKKLETIPTEKGAHTIAFNPQVNMVYAFLPQTHTAAVYQDG